MSRLTYFVLSILIAFLALTGCSTVGNLPTSTAILATGISTTLIETPTHTPLAPTATQTFIPPTLTLTPLPVVPTATPKAVLPPEDIITYKPIELIPSLPAGVRPSGSLVLEGEDSYILHFDENLRLEPLDEEGCLSTSPDGQWLTYCTGNRRLYIESADRQQHSTIWLEFNLWGPGWVNNQMLVFSSFKEYDNGIHPVVLVDPFTGRHVQSPIDFPGFAGGFCGPSQGAMFQFGGTSLVYDPSLNLIIYPDMSDPSYIVLWDIQAKKALAKIEENICFGNRPLWSPDGQRFVVAVDRGEQKWLEDWASVSREGQVEWLTHFADYFEKDNIEELDIMLANWSPDNRRVAFWLRTIPDLCSNEKPNQKYLALLDVDTQQVVNYCISGGDSTPVWSLDGRYIVIQRFNDEGLNQVLLVDLEQGWAATIAGTDIWPRGWLNAP
jgi:hypothetical protein